MRTRFAISSGQPIQIISPAVTIAVPVTDFRNTPEPHRTEEAERFTVADAVKRFDLSVLPLIRVNLLQLADEEHMLLITVHHIVSDGWSIGIITNELGAIYEEFLHGRESKLPELPIQYADFTVWQKDLWENEPLNQDLDYWREKLRDLPQPEVMTDFPRPAVQGFDGEIISMLLPKTLTDSLRDLSVQHGVTLFTTMLGVFNVLLQRYTGQEDIVVGSPIAGRNKVEIEPLIGVFINTLVLRTALTGNPTFTELLSRVSTTVLESVAHQEVPFEQLVEVLRPKRDAGRNPLFQINFAYQRDFIKPLQFGNITLTAIPSRSPGAIFDLNFFLVERAEGWRASCEFNTKLYEKATAVRMLSHYRNLLESVAANPRQRLSDLEIFSIAERQQLLIGWNSTRLNIRGSAASMNFLKTRFARRRIGWPSFSKISSLPINN